MKSLLDTFVIRPNKWWDSLPEPRRFLTFLGAFSLISIVGASHPAIWVITLPLVLFRMAAFYLNHK